MRTASARIQLTAIFFSFFNFISFNLLGSICILPFFPFCFHFNFSASDSTKNRILFCIYVLHFDVWLWLRRLFFTPCFIWLFSLLSFLFSSSSSLSSYYIQYMLCNTDGFVPFSHFYLGNTLFAWQKETCFISQ